MSDQKKLDRAVARYRRHVQDLLVLRSTVLRRGGPKFPPFLGRLTGYDDGVADFDMLEMTSPTRTNEQRNQLVRAIRDLCGPDPHSDGTYWPLAAWYATTGWVAPDARRTPRRHPERVRALLIFESTATADTCYALERGDPKMRWRKLREPAGPDGNRYTNLIDRRQPPLRIIGSTSKAVH